MISPVYEPSLPTCAYLWTMFNANQYEKLYMRQKLQQNDILSALINASWIFQTYNQNTGLFTTSLEVCCPSKHAAFASGSLHCTKPQIQIPKPTRLSMAMIIIYDIPFINHYHRHITKEKKEWKRNLNQKEKKGEIRNNIFSK